MQEVENPDRVDDGKAFALAMAQIASDVKGQDLCLLHVTPLCTWTSWMLLVSVTSRPQQQAVLACVTQEAKGRWDRAPRSASTGQFVSSSPPLLLFQNIEATSICSFQHDRRPFAHAQTFSSVHDGTSSGAVSPSVRSLVPFIPYGIESPLAHKLLPAQACLQ